MEKFDFSQLSQLPAFSGNGDYTGVFYNEDTGERIPQYIYLSSATTVILMILSFMVSILKK
jgi:hypothetical protein